MKLRRYALGLALALTMANSAQAQTAATTTTVKIIGFNDFHGNLQSPGTFIGVPAGGVDVLAGYVAKLKSQNPYNVTVHAGDMIGASPLISAFFYDEGAIETLNRLGLDFASVGNHEFDFGKTELLRKKNGGCAPGNATGKLTCQGNVPGGPGTPVPFEGAKFKYLSANVVDTSTNKTLFPPYAIKTFSTPNGTVRVGFIGMTLQATPTIVTPSGVAGLQFNDEAATVNALVPKLRGLGVESIVVVVHQGGFNSSGISSCPGDPGNTDTTNPVGLAGSDIAKIVNQLDDAVDLVISGHTHNAYVCRVPNSTGRRIPVTSASAFGRVVTDINLTINNTTGDVTSVSAANTIIDNRAATLTAQGITPIPTITNIVNGYATLVSPLSSQIIGNITADVPNTRQATGDNAAGNLIADAQLQATQSAPASAQIAFMNPGGVRVSGFLNSGTTPANSGNVSYGQAFTVQPFGNSLVTMPLSAQQLKNALEQQFNGCQLPGKPIQTATRILLTSAGFNWSWDNTRSLCDKVTKILLNGSPIYENGAVSNPNAIYRVTVNSFLATGGDNFSTFNEPAVADRVGGAQDIDALVNYFGGFKSPTFLPYNPANFPARITRQDLGITFP
jgi:5'-nucleotidase